MDEAQNHERRSGFLYISYPRKGSQFSHKCAAQTNRPVLRNSHSGDAHIKVRGASPRPNLGKDSSRLREERVAYWRGHRKLGVVHCTAPTPRNEVNCYLAMYMVFYGVGRQGTAWDLPPPSRLLALAFQGLLLLANVDLFQSSLYK